MTLTLAHLKSLGACEDQVELFESRFGESVELTKELMIEQSKDFDLDWLADEILSTDDLKAYDEAIASALKAYEEAEAPALKAYEEAAAPAWKAYEEAVAPALKAYDEAGASSLYDILSKGDYLK